MVNIKVIYVFLYNHIILWIPRTPFVLFSLSSFLFLTFFWNPFSLFHCPSSVDLEVIYFFITLVNTLEITISILNVLNSTLIHIFIFFLQNTKILENLTPCGRYRNVSQIFWCGEYGWLLAPATASPDPPQFCAKAMLPLRSSHPVPRVTTVGVIVSVILAQHRLLLMDKFCLRTAHWPGWNILRPVLLSGPLLPVVPSSFSLSSCGRPVLWSDCSPHLLSSLLFIFHGVSSKQSLAHLLGFDICFLGS